MQPDLDALDGLEGALEGGGTSGAGGHDVAAGAFFDSAGGHVGAVGIAEQDAHPYSDCCAFGRGIPPGAPSRTSAVSCAPRSATPYGKS